MANALAVIGGIGADSAGLLVSLSIRYTGTDVPVGQEQGEVQCYLDPADQPAAIRSKMSASIAADAAARGFTVAGTNMTIPTFQKG